MERLPNRYPKISQSHKVPLYKGLSLFYPKLWIMSGINGPRMFVMKEMVNQNIIINASIPHFLLFFMIYRSFIELMMPLR